MSIHTSRHSFDVESFFRHEVAGFTRELAEIERRAADATAPARDELLQRLSAAVHQSREDCRRAEEAMKGDGVLLKETQERFRDAIAHWFDQSWFMQRAKTKPRGYPGDYEMLTAIYDGEPKSAGFGGYLDLYFLSTELARAVCSRMDAIQKFLVGEVLRRSARVSILNVACGPGREYLDGFQSTRESVQLTCIDTDESALDYLRASVNGGNAPLDLNCICYNALRMTSPKQNIETFGQPDIVYSVGLCDYLPDRYLVRILRGWRESVAEEGIVYVAFKDAPRYYPAEYQWHVDWHFYERTEADCRNLFAEAGYDMDSLRMFRDSTGIIMNFVSGLQSAAEQRRDDSHRLPAPHVTRGIEPASSQPPARR